jgi:LacI family transcriptional regulator
MRVTVREVAREAGVSLGTVSRVLNGHPTVDPGAARRVRRAVRELGYAPLRRRGPAGDRPLRGRNVALVLLGMDRTLVQLPVVAAAIHGAEAEVTGAGANLLLVDLPRLDRVPDVLGRGRIDGLLVKSALQGDVLGGAAPALLARLRGRPTVWMMGKPPGAWGDEVSPDEGAVGPLAAEHLAARGHRNLGFLNPKPDHVLFRRRQQSFTDHARRLGARVRCILGKPGDWQLPLRTIAGPEVLRGLVDRFLGDRDRPTALFVPADSIAAMTYRALAERGVEVGRDVGIVSCNHEPALLAGLHPALTTIDIHAERVGRRAVEQLAWRMAHREEAPVEVGIEPSLVEGDSVVPLRRRSS